MESEKEEAMGKLIASNVDLHIEVSDPSRNEHEQRPGLGWTLSAEAVDEMRAIDDHIRAAEQLSGNLLLG